MGEKVIDLFCGGGGLSLGFANAGYDIVAAADNWAPALEFYKANIHGHPLIEMDLSKTDETVSKLSKYDFDIIVGGPPCQDFSSAGKRDESLGRANLTISFANIIARTTPHYFVMENVARAAKSRTFAQAKEIFEKAGYGLSIAVLDASLCGVPQKRKRLFVVGEKNASHDLMLPIYRKNQATSPMTIRDFFGNSLGINHYYRHPRSYKRRGIFSIDEPSPTIRGVNRPVPQGYPGHPGDSVPLHPDLRPLTTKERSLIQTFPPEFELVGTKSAVEQIIGNAVPVKLAEFVAKCLAEHIKENKTKGAYQPMVSTPMFQPTMFEQRAKYA